jgi:hypothetical protein
MSPTTVEPRFTGGPTLPEIAGMMAGLLAIAIALAPTLAAHGPMSNASDTPAGHAMQTLETPEPSRTALTAGPPAELHFAEAPGSLAAGARCQSGSADYDIPRAGAYCTLPPREKALEEIRFVNLSFAWPRLDVPEKR